MRSARKYRVNSASIRPSFFRNTGAISCTVLTCSKRFSIMGWPLWASRTWAGERPRSLVISGYIGDGLLVHDPLDVEAPLCDLAVGRVGPGAASPCLLVHMFFTHRAANHEVAIDVVLIEKCLDLKVDLSGAA